MDKSLLDVLACPKCKGVISLKNMFILCKKCRLAYPILEGVPDMLVEEAWPLKKAEKAGFKHEQKL